MRPKKTKKVLLIAIAAIAISNYEVKVAKGDDGCGDLKINKNGSAKSFSAEFQEAKKRIGVICNPQNNAFVRGAKDHKTLKILKACSEAQENNLNGTSLFESKASQLRQHTTEICEHVTSKFINTEKFCRKNAKNSADSARSVEAANSELPPTDEENQVGYFRKISGIYVNASTSFSHLSKAAEEARTELDSKIGSKAGDLCVPTNGARSNCPKLRSTIKEIIALSRSVKGKDKGTGKVDLTACKQLEPALTKHVEMMEAQLIPNVRRISKSLKAVEDEAAWKSSQMWDKSIHSNNLANKFADEHSATQDSKPMARPGKLTETAYLKEEQDRLIRNGENTKLPAGVRNRTIVGPDRGWSSSAQPTGAYFTKTSGSKSTKYYIYENSDGLPFASIRVPPAKIK